jgi:hypothetical protein
MLTLNGKNGDQLEVTFVLSTVPFTLVTEETINGHTALLLADIIKVSAGDRCRVSLVDCESGKGIVQLQEVIKPGDGLSSLRQKTFRDIHGSVFNGRLPESQVFSNLRARCGSETEMLEVLLDVLEAYSFETPPSRRPLAYGHYCIVIARLINSLHTGDAAAQAALFRRAAGYCEARDGGKQWAESFRVIADSLDARARTSSESA